MKTTRILPNEKFGAMDPVSRNLRTSHSAYREMLTPSVVVLALATVAGFVVLYALIGAAGTDAVLDWPQRLAFWGVAAVVCFPVCYSKSVLALYMAGSRPFPQILLAVSVTTAISALPATALVYTLDRILLPPHPEHDLAALYLWVFAPMLLGSVFVVYLVSGTSKRARVADAAAEGAAAQRRRLRKRRRLRDTVDGGSSRRRRHTAIPVPGTPFRATGPRPDLSQNERSLRGGGHFRRQRDHPDALRRRGDRACRPGNAGASILLGVLSPRCEAGKGPAPPVCGTGGGAQDTGKPYLPLRGPSGRRRPDGRGRHPSPGLDIRRDAGSRTRRDRRNTIANVEGPRSRDPTATSADVRREGCPSK